VPSGAGLDGVLPGTPLLTGGRIAGIVVRGHRRTVAGAPDIARFLEAMRKL
jgi:hypothetical protein